MTSSIPYTVFRFSSESESNVADELNNVNSNRGWQSAPYASFPQQVVLQFPKTTIHHMELLSHHSKIAHRIELHAGMASSRDNSVRWRRLGFFSLNSNERSNFKSRELKTVPVNIKANMLKLILLENHINARNPSNQVGIMRIELFGDQPNVSSRAPVPAASKTAGFKKKNGGNGAIKAGDIRGMVETLRRQQNEAVDEEDYQEAKRLKGSIDKLSKVTYITHLLISLFYLC